LARAREQSRRTVCAHQLGEFGHALSMYTVEHKDSLPGPVHAAVELETTSLNTPGTGEYDGYHVGSFLRKYFGERSRTTSGKFTDTMASCPTAKSLSTQNLSNATQLSTVYRTFTYSLNNWKFDYSNSGRIIWGTNPPWYFGYPNYYWQDAPAPFVPL